MQVYCLYKGDYFSSQGIKEFQSELELERKIGCSIEAVPINDELVLIRGVEYNVLKVPVNRLWLKDNKPIGVVYGDAFVVRVGADNYYASILESDIDFIEKTFRPVLMHTPNKVYSYLRKDLGIADWKIKQ